MDSRNSNLYFYYSSKTSGTKIANAVVIQTINSYIDIYVVPNLKKFVDVDGSIDITQILKTKQANNEVEFSEFIDNEYGFYGQDFKSVIKVIRRLVYGDLDENDLLMSSLLGIDCKFGVKNSNISEYNKVISMTIKNYLNKYSQGEVEDLICYKSF